MELPMEPMRTQGQIQQIRKPPAGIQRPQNLAEMASHHVFACGSDNQRSSQLTFQG